MSFLGNLQRDQFHISLLDSELSAWGNTSVKNRTIDINARATVFEAETSLFGTNQTVTNVAGNWSGVGAFLIPPDIDNEPYRIRGYLGIDVPEKFIFVAYGPASPINGINACTDAIALPINDDGRIDEVLLVKSIDSADPKFGLPVAIGVAVGESAGKAADFALSIQRMRKASPTYASSMS